VLRLVAQGKTSKAIARALTITEKTAGHHVEHIYAKVCVSTRVGAGLFATEHDLVEGPARPGMMGRSPDAACGRPA